MNIQTKSLYDILGGPTVMNAVVEDFYRRVLQDERINHYFEHMDMTRQHEHQIAFISQVLGGPEQYSGRSMVEAHAGLNLTTSDFDAVATHLEASLEQVDISQTQIDEVMSRIAGLEHQILYDSPQEFD